MKFNLLIAEDDEDIRYIYSKMKLWEECGFTLAKQVSDGAAALRELATGNYDLLLTDIRMPLMDGIELLKEVRTAMTDIEVIFVSSYNDFEYARQGLVLGAFDYILKPIDKAQLKKSLLRVKEKLAEKRYSEISSKYVELAFSQLGISRGNAFNKKLYEFLSANGESIASMEQTAEHFELSKDYFGKLFKQNTGVSFVNFMTMLKVELAKELVKNSTYKIYEISDILGYSSPDYFRQIFKEATGMTPLEYKSK